MSSVVIARSAEAALIHNTAVTHSRGTSKILASANTLNLYDAAITRDSSSQSQDGSRIRDQGSVVVEKRCRH